MSTRGISWGKGGRCVRLTTYHNPVPLSQNLGTLTSWNPLGLSWPVMGLLYFNCPIVIQNNNIFNSYFKCLCFVGKMVCNLSAEDSFWCRGYKRPGTQQQFKFRNCKQYSSTEAKSLSQSRHSPTFKKTPNFIAVDKTARQLSLSWARRIQSTRRLLQSPF